MPRRTLAVVSAGLSQPSSSRLLADQLAAATVAELGARPGGGDVDTHVIEVRELARDVTNNLVTGFPSAALKAAVDAVAGADGLIVVGPTFRASISGMLKSFLDVLDDRALDGKPVLLGATGGSARHSLVLEHVIRPVFTYMHAIVVPTGVFAATDDWADPAGAGRPPRAGDTQGAPLRTRITRAARELATEIERRPPVVVADPFALTTSFEDLLNRD